MRSKYFWGKGVVTEQNAVCPAGTNGKSEVFNDAVEWFAQMVEERKHNNDHIKEKKNW